MVMPYWPEPELPNYRRGSFGRWSCARTPIIKHSAGYFLPYRQQPPGWMFKRDRTVWMSLTKMETESQSPMIAAAHGHTVIAGLGMGFALYNIMRKPEVTRVTLLEIDVEVIGLMDRVTDWRYWPGNEKVELVIGDARVYAPEHPVAFLYADTWPHLGDHDAVPTTQAIQANVKASGVGWWGQELDFVDYCCARKIPTAEINRKAYRAYAEYLRMPLIEQNSLIYPRLCLLAAAMQAAGNSKDPNRKRRLLGTCQILLEEDPLDAALAYLSH